MIDPISDMLTRIRNASKLRHEEVTVPYSEFKIKVLDVLKQKGYVGDYEKTKQGKIDVIKVMLLYDNNESKISDLQRISKPSQRIYVNKRNIPKSKQGLGIMIISTPKGLMTDDEARKQRIGGELLCEVW